MITKVSALLRETYEAHKYNMVEFLDMSFAQRCNMCIFSTDKTYDDRKADFYEAFGLGMFHVTHPEVLSMCSSS